VPGECGGAGAAASVTYDLGPRELAKQAPPPDENVEAPFEAMAELLERAAPARIISRIKCEARLGVTSSGLRLWISREQPAARLAGTHCNTQNAAMYEHHVARSGLRGKRN
jgi:hypothetical protein